MICYAEMTIKLHGLSAPTVEEIEQHVREALLPTFGQRFETDIEIEVTEYAGTEH